MRKNKQQVANKAEQLLIPGIKASSEPNPTEKWLHERIESEISPSKISSELAQNTETIDSEH